MGVDFSDRYIEGKIINANSSPDDIVSSYMNIDIKSINPDRAFSMFMDLQSARDEITEFSIAQEIKQNFRKEKLFRSQGHLETRLLMNLASTLFWKIGATKSQIKELERSSNERNIPVQIHNAPIHPAVIKHFSLDFIDSGEKYFLWNRFVTFEEFVRLYVVRGWSDIVERGLRLRDSGANDEAIAVLSDALLLHRHSGRIRMALADILSAQGNFDRALAYIDEALSCPYANSGYQFERANLLRRMGRNDDAISSINHAIRLDPNLPEYFALKADLLESKSEDPTSARMNAVKLAPFIPKYRNSLVSSLQSRNATRLLTAKRDAEMVQYHAEISATLR